jgi:hypothetical protein
MKSKIHFKYFLSLAFLIIATGCEKQEMYNQIQEIQGYWKIIGISGGITGGQSIQDFDVVSFDTSDKYSVYFNDLIIQGGSYKIEEQEPIEYGNTKIEFLLTLNESFNNHPDANFCTDWPMYVIFFGNDTLTLSQAGIMDGFNYHFVRKK